MSDNHPDQMLAHTLPPGLKKNGKIAIYVLAAIAVIGIGWRLYERHKTREWTKEQLIPTVGVITLSSSAPGSSLSLPAQMQAFANAPIYAQVSGYVQTWSVDIGAQVKKGQLLAQIDPRSYQAALEQAKGALTRDTAVLNNAKTDLARYQALAAQNAISNQQLAAQQTSVNADAGVVAADKGAVQQAAINLAYTRIIAPFDGVVTARTVDVGAYVAAGAGASNQPLFTVSDRKRLRLYVSVPQNLSGNIHNGMHVTYTVPDFPGRSFTATLEASSGAIAQATNTMLVQFVTDNASGALKPGGYANVQLPLAAGANGINLPATTLIFRDSGMQVAVVGHDNKIEMRPITITRDNGASVDIAPGSLTAGDRIVDNPPDALQAGDVVRVAAPAKKN